MSVDSVPPSSQLRERMWVPGPDGDMYYNLRYFWGFTQIQDMLDTAIIESHATLTSGVYLQQFPYPCFKRDNYNSGLYTAQIIPVALIFGFSLIVAISVRDNVWEKESENIQLMRVMGVHYSDILMANFSFLFVINIVDTSLLTIILHFGGLLPHSNPLIIFLVVFSFGMSVIMFIFLLSLILEKASSGSVAAFLLFIITFLPFIIMIAVEEQVHIILKMMAMSTMMSTSFGFCLLYMTRYEQRGEGLQWHNMMTSPLEDDQFNALYSLVFLLVDTLIYLVLAVIISKYSSLSGNLNLGSKKRKVRSYEDGDQTNTTRGIHVSGLRKVFRVDRRHTRVAVDIEQLLIRENEITGLLGHNGAGKSTTISMITGMLLPTEGQISVNNSQSSKMIGYCPQFSVLYDNLTVREHLQFYARLKSGKNEDKDVRLMMNKMNILDKSDTLSCNLSEGIRRRLSVALAFIGDSKVVILDEPTSGVDPKSRKDIWNLISQYKEGRTILVSTHYMDEAEVLCDQIVIMNKGKIVEKGTSKELQSQYGLDLKLEIQTAASSGAGSEVTSTSSSRVSSPASLVSSNNKIDQHVTNLCPSIRRDKSASHRKRVYTLPSKNLEDLSMYQKLFAVLENEKEILNIKSFSVSSPSLEDIFLGIVSNEEIENIIFNTSKTAKVSPAKFAGSKSSLLSEVSSSTSTSGPPLYEPGRTSRHSGIRLLVAQLAALLLKRLLNFVGNKRMVFLSFIIPTILLILAMVTATIRPVTSTPKILLTPSMYGPGSVSFISNINSRQEEIVETFFKSPGIGTTCMENFTSETEYVACRPVSQYSEANRSSEVATECSCSHNSFWTCGAAADKVTVQLTTENTTDILYNLGDTVHPNQWILNTFDDFIEKRYGGWRFGAEREATDSIGVTRENGIVYFNNKGFHSVAAYLNAMNNARLRRAVGAEGAHNFGITAYSHPVRGKDNQVTGQSLEQHISDYSLSLLMAVVLTFLPASSIIYLIEERTTDQKLVQRTYKVGPLTYWTAVLVWDLLLDLVFLGMAALIILAFQVRSFTANDNLGASVLLMLLYCLASNSLVYLLEKCFREPSMGQIIVLTSFIFTSLLTCITMLLLTMFWWIRPLQKAKEILQVLLLVFPPYALSKFEFLNFTYVHTLILYFIGGGFLNLAQNQIFRQEL